LPTELGPEQPRYIFSENDRLVESVRSSASNLLSLFKDKLQRLQGNRDVSDLFIRQGYNGKLCFEEAMKFFGTNEVRYLAVDGTEFFELRLDMVVFYAGAFAYGGITRFVRTGEIITEPPASEGDYSSLSSAIPLSEEYSSDVYGEVDGGGIELDPGKVSGSLMRLAEYWLVYDAISRDPSLRIILMDRTVSADIAHVSWKLREFIEKGSCRLLGFDTSFGAISKIDLELGRMLVRNDELGIPPPRSQFLKFAVFSLLLKEGRPLTLEEIMKGLGLRKQGLVEENEKKANKILELKGGEDFKDAFVETKKEQQDDVFQLTEKMAQYFDRLLEATKSVVSHIFNFSGEGHPLKIKDSQSGVEKWLTCEDIDYLTLVLITQILQECWKRNILLLGIVKDSAANELVRTVIPVLQKASLLEKKIEIEKFESDTMLLQANSIVNYDSLSCPWRTFEYDVCFRTINPLASETSLVKGECIVQGAYKNVIAPERMFVKAYFQLWCSESNPAVRSHVFLYDRPCYAQYDNVRELILKNYDNRIEEEIFPAIHFAADCPISELTIAILDSMGREAIPEALGHNYPLFLADKRAKVAYEEALRSCVSAVELEITKSRFDQQVLFQGKFRNQRSGVESLRKKSKKATISSR
jgi:DNA-binding PadR family transcriptional regulator